MSFSGMNYLAVLVEAIAAFVFGALWYSILGKPWLAALGRTEQPKPDPKIFVMTFVCQLVMAFMMAGLIGHLGKGRLAAVDGKDYHSRIPVLVVVGVQA